MADTDNIISPAQCRAARALLNISQEELAGISDVSKPTIADYERGQRSPYRRTLRDLRAALEARGVVFITDAEGRVGVVIHEVAVARG